MTLPKVQGVGFREYEIAGCPLINVRGLECVSLWRVIELLGQPRKEVCRRLGLTGNAPFVRKEAKDG